jgi:Domain of unknown function (DUF1918)
MRAQPGDRLLVGHDRHRIGLIVDLPRPDGQPPYIVKWLSDGHIAMVFPDQYTRVIPAGHPAGTGLGTPPTNPAQATAAPNRSLA